MSLVPCMGGWGRQREGCAHYIAPVVRLPVPERLCPQGEDQPEPIKRPKETGEIA